MGMEGVSCYDPYLLFCYFSLLFLFFVFFFFLSHPLPDAPALAYYKWTDSEIRLGAPVGPDKALGYQC